MACPRLSIDWGYAFPKPLLSPYEVNQLFYCFASLSSTHDWRLVTWQIHFLKAHYSLPLWAQLECETQLASKWLDEQSPSWDHGSCRKLVPERRVTEGDMTLTGFIINFSYWPIQFLSSRKNFCLGRLVMMTTLVVEVDDRQCFLFAVCLVSN